MCYDNCCRLHYQSRHPKHDPVVHYAVCHVMMGKSCLLCSLHFVTIASPNDTKHYPKGKICEGSCQMSSNRQPSSKWGIYSVDRLSPGTQGLLTTLSIHRRNLLTRVYTPGKAGFPQPWPQEMTPVRTQRPPWP